MKLNLTVLIVLFSFFSLKTKATDWYLSSNTSLSCLLLSSWTNASNGSGGTSPSSFTTSGDIWHFQNRPITTILLASQITFVSTSTIIIGDGTNNAKLRFNGLAQFSGSP
jgi:hypothetical protein